MEFSTVEIAGKRVTVCRVAVRKTARARRKDAHGIRDRRMRWPPATSSFPTGVGHYFCYNFHIPCALASCRGASPQTEIIITMLRKPHPRLGGFTLVEIMIVASIIALLAMVAIPNFLRSRKRSQATQVLQDLRLIDSAVDQYALEYSKIGGSTVTWPDVQKYLKPGTRLYTSNGDDTLGNPYTIPTVDDAPKVAAATFSALSDVAPADFWSPFH